MLVIVVAIFMMVVVIMVIVFRVVIVVVATTPITTTPRRWFVSDRGRFLREITSQNPRYFDQNVSRCSLAIDFSAVNVSTAVVFISLVRLVSVVLVSHAKWPSSPI